MVDTEKKEMESQRIGVSLCRTETARSPRGRHQAVCATRTADRQEVEVCI